MYINDITFSACIGYRWQLKKWKLIGPMINRMKFPLRTAEWIWQYSNDIVNKFVFPFENVEVILKYVFWGFEMAKWEKAYPANVRDWVRIPK